MSLLHLFPLSLLPFSPQSIENKNDLARKAELQAYLNTEVRCERFVGGHGAKKELVFEFSVSEIKDALGNEGAQLKQNSSIHLSPMYLNGIYSFVAHIGDYAFEVPVPSVAHLTERVRIASLFKANSPLNLMCYVEAGHGQSPEAKID